MEKTKKIKSKIVEVIGTRNGWGAASHNTGYSHLVVLECGHREFVKNSLYKGIGSMVVCSDCDQVRTDTETGITRTIIPLAPEPDIECCDPLCHHCDNPDSLV